MTTEAQEILSAMNAKKGETENQIINILFDQDDVSWKTIIYELIRTEQMDPWNIDVSAIAEKFIELLSEMQKMDFRISGKIILAAAFFLKIKSDKLVKEDIAFLDSMIRPLDNPEDFLDMLDDSALEMRIPTGERPALNYKTPQPRKRKVSVYDLVNALEKALESDQRRTINRMRSQGKKIKIPEKTRDMSDIINELFDKIKVTLEKVKVVWFNQIIPSESKEDKINTFIPLIFLEGQNKLDLEQKEHFGDIKICLSKMAQRYTEPN